MAPSIFVLLAIALLGFQIYKGVVFAGGQMLQRRQSPGPFWFIIGIQVFCFIILGLATLAISTGRE